MRHLLMALLSMTVLFALSGCALEPVQQPAMTQYQLVLPKSESSTSGVVAPNKQPILLLQRMTASEPFNGKAMYFSQGEYSLGSYASHQWVAPPQNMLTGLLNQYLTQHAGLFVVPGGYIGFSNYSLMSHLNSLMLLDKQSQLLLEVACTLKDNRTGKVIGQKEFKIESSAIVSPEGMVKASSQASLQLASEINQWLIASLKAQPEP
ncbi:ABC-type transport auxiliary lipoprotein family protein [Dongshaea marina]|uniref:ABC-type transport auxiliary lipoprotein family protein n=1 Tax=Dongshaea marina TaxID=2047966 RepID=UPI000D3E475A|nr:ABC-type transport auxiliary lipoprotein family protein [Dongshaea marina]